MATCRQPSAKCLTCQCTKLFSGMASGAHSFPEQPGSNQHAGVLPRMFKSLVGADHPEFSSMRQQDSAEFLRHFLRLVERNHQQQRLPGPDPSTVFSFEIAERLECLSCHAVRRSTAAAGDLHIRLPLDGTAAMGDCLAAAFSPVEIDDFRCPNCGKVATALRSSGFSTFPERLLLHVDRFTFDRFVVRKVLTPLGVPPSIDLAAFRLPTAQPGEIAMKETVASPPSDPRVDALVAIDIPRVRAQRAVAAVGAGASAEEAMTWLIDHMDDPDIDTPLTSAAPSAASLKLSSEDVAALIDMGFSERHARRALTETGGSMERAVDWIFSHDDVPDVEPTSAPTPAPTPAPTGDAHHSKYELSGFITHLGPSTSAGHYVAHALVPLASGTQGWVVFNDDRVALAPEPPVQNAYLVMFSRRAA
eukprot:TRINITY_DN4646_c0_g1_i3.p1 TRINITY_DN4646_c0_g1~~TRINITY_DN4646_c0_g1_i3.p1  ORF type:complete len:419 (+),score=63.35 TRINITY_DN4646_c0_g1_i3:1158-2414(+)